MKSIYRFSAALLLSAVCTTATLPPADAQIQLIPKLRELHPTARQSVLFAPGIQTMRKSKPHAVPRSAIKTRGVQDRTPFVSTDPILFSTLDDLNGDNTLDVLWGFPTLGRDPATDPDFVFVDPNTVQAAATSPNNFANIALGQIGGPGLISQITYLGALYRNDFAGTARNGSILIRFYDGVDFTTADRPLNSKIARKVNGNPAEYIVRFTSAADFAFRSENLDTTSPTVINDPQGRFGVLIAKVDDPGNPGNSPASVVWWSMFAGADGPNLNWALTNGNDTTLGLYTIFADANWNQGAFTLTDMNEVLPSNSPYNYYFEVQGRNQDNTIPGVGTLEGNLRMRGIDPPDGSDGTATELRPNFYAVSLFGANGGPLMRTDYVYSQPSYDAEGLLTNYRVQGVRAGDYDVVVQQLPVQNSTGMIDIRNSLDFWPFADYVPSFTLNVNVAAGGTTTLNSRLERFGDMNFDGTVDVLDLDVLIMAFDTLEGDPGFIAGADVAGDPSVNLGAPDGSVDVYDLDALIRTFDTGFGESP